MHVYVQKPQATRARRRDDGTVPAASLVQPARPPLPSAWLSPLPTAPLSSLRPDPTADAVPSLPAGQRPSHLVFSPVMK